jgi:hypothetical protein
MVASRCSASATPRLFGHAIHVTTTSAHQLPTSSLRRQTRFTTSNRSVSRAKTAMATGLGDVALPISRDNMPWGRRTSTRKKVRAAQIPSSASEMRLTKGSAWGNRVEKNRRSGGKPDSAPLISSPDPSIRAGSLKRRALARHPSG